MTTSRGRRRRRVGDTSRRSPASSPKSLELVLGNQIYIAKDGLHPGLRNRLLRLAAFQNPEFYKAQAMRLSTYDKPRVIACAEDHPHHIALPRGCLDDVRQTLARAGHSADRSRRALIAGSRWTSRFAASCGRSRRPRQTRCSTHDTGVLAATTAFGKTVVAAWLIAQRGVNTLVLVHRRQLLDQWIERLSTFLGLPAKSIGRIGGGRNRPTGLLDVAVIQSLVRKGVVDDRVADYGHVIVDECHHLSAHSFEQVARQAKARFVARAVRDRRAQGRAPSDHLHAVRAGAASREREGAGGGPTVRALRPRAADRRSSRPERRTPTSVSSSRRSIRSWSTTRLAIGASATTSSSPCATAGRRWC